MCVVSSFGEEYAFVVRYNICNIMCKVWASTIFPFYDTLVLQKGLIHKGMYWCNMIWVFNINRTCRMEAQCDDECKVSKHKIKVTLKVWHTWTNVQGKWRNKQYELDKESNDTPNLKKTKWAWDITRHNTQKSWHISPLIYSNDVVFRHILS